MPGKFAGGRGTGAIGADGRGRGTVADQMHARILCDLGCEASGHDDAATLLAQLQGCEVIESASKTGAPEDDIDSARAAVLPANTARSYL